MSKKTILMFFTQVPFPLRAHGISVRYLPIIEYLADRHEMDAILVVSGPEERRRAESLRAYFRKTTILPDPKASTVSVPVKLLSYLRFLMPWTPPMSFVAHSTTAVTTEIGEATNGARYDSVLCVGSYLLPTFFKAIPSISADRVFVDFVDSPFLWALRSKKNLLRIGLLDGYERWKTRRWEAEVIRKSDGTIYISKVDAFAVPTGYAPLKKRHVVPNGINIPADGNGERISLPSPNIGFLGTMGYKPNIEAVEWLYKEVFVPLRNILPNLTLVVVGRHPSKEIRDLGKSPGVLVTGAVDDIWAYINAIDVFLFTILRGAGLKNKILEAMYAGRPVITTEIGNEGIDAIDGENIVLRKTPEDFQREAIRLLDTPEERVRMGKSARAFVKERFSWPPILSAYEKIILGHVLAVGPKCKP